MRLIDTRLTIGIGLIGSGFIGRAHMLALRTASGVFPLRRVPRLELLADQDEAKAVAAADAFGFARATSDWESLVRDSAVDVVSITTPNRLHAPMALAAIAAGKHVWCEKLAVLRVTEAVRRSSATRRWVDLDEVENA